MGDPDVTSGAALHAGKRRWLFIVGGNALLFIVMLGLPYARGYLRTRALWRAFASYGACLYGGTPAADPGLGMPRGHEAHFATRALREPGFAAACAAQLDALAPDEAIFLMPGVKVAERDLRAAAALVRDELAPLAARTPGSRLSVRPLRAIERLRAGLANHALAAGAAEVPYEEAFRLSLRKVLPSPTRVPFAAGPDAQVAVWGSDSDLHGLAIDRGGISSVHLRAGKLAQTRIARPSLLEAAVPTGAPALYVWAMGRARCAEREDGCANKTLGVAPLVLPADDVPAPRWLGAHPSGRVDRSVVRSDDGVTVAALRPDKQTEVRQFRLPLDDAGRPDMPPLGAYRTYPGSAPGEPLVLASEAGPRVLTIAREGSKIVLRELSADGPETLAELTGKGPGWLVGCSERDRLGLVLGDDSGLTVADLTGATLTRHLPVPIVLTDAVDARDARRDRVVRLCGYDDRAVVVAHDRRGQLWVVQCQVGEASCRHDVLARAVRNFAVLAAGEQLIVAYAGEGESIQVRVRSVALDAIGEGDEQVPAVCWSDDRGLCGAPMLARLGQRILLGAREGADLMLLESDVLGTRWSALEGLSRYH
jgi:hypothetical protein